MLGFLPFLFSACAPEKTLVSHINPVGFYTDPDGAPFMTYPLEVTEVEQYDDLMFTLDTLHTDDFAIMTVSAYWCQPCQDLKPLLDYAAEFDMGQHLWIVSEDTPGDEEYPTSDEIWDRWLESTMEFMGCWDESDFSDYFPKVMILEKLPDGSYEVHVVKDYMSFFREANGYDRNTSFYYDTEITFRTDEDNEIFQVETNTGEHANDQ